ncbi:MAG: DNA starvation/stationary phase protection protein [Bacteroidales bacterium]|nr:DNA starvation/stationary phase protection protein [Bacteroidales bacterium]
MKTNNSIGIDIMKASEIASKLNHLLANYQVFYQNVRGFHWNIKGDKFFELHLKFEELYTSLATKIDEIAERILTLGYTPDHTYSDYVAKSQVKEVKDVSEPTPAVQSILDAFSIILPLQRELLQLTAEAIDEGTNALMSDYIREQEKLVWMYSAYIQKV